MYLRLPGPWQPVLEPLFNAPDFARLLAFVTAEYGAATVYPPPELIFRALELCPPDGVKVVIVGQDPYHGPGQANGLCFSVNPGQTLPPSLRNIFKELGADLGRPPASDQTLELWAQQGVLLLNATLTVRSGQAASHGGRGWEQFTDAVLREVNKRREHVVFILWGAYAQKKAAFVDRSRHLVLCSAHPSPLSAHGGFWGSRPFSQANAALRSWGLGEINW
jgi:uracil-DNA glycosylase